MTYEDDRQRQVRTGQAMNLAWHYATLHGGGGLEEKIQTADAAVVPLIEWINTVQARQEFTGSAAAQSQAQPAPQQFAPAQLDRAPERQAPAPAPAPVQQQYGPAQQPTAQPAPNQPYQQPAPAPIPNQSQGGGDWKAQKADEGFRTFFQDTTAWEDLRFEKQSGKIKPGNPDFRHRSLKDGDYKLGVWLKDAPEWALPQLRQMGLVA